MRFQGTVVFLTFCHKLQLYLAQQRLNFVKKVFYLPAVVHVPHVIEQTNAKKAFSHSSGKILGHQLSQLMQLPSSSA